MNSKSTLAGQDLWSFLCATKPERQALTNAEKRRRKKEQKSKEFEKLKQTLHQAAEAMNLWTPIARIYVTFQVTCHCGNEFCQPELHISDKPLIEFQHKRTKETKISRADWSEIPANLPGKNKFLPAKSCHCPECIGLLTQHLPSPPPIQLELFGESHGSH
jgi:hypothetical protein